MTRIKVSEDDVRDIIIGHTIPWDIYATEKDEQPLYKSGTEVCHQMLVTLITQIKQGAFHEIDVKKTDYEHPEMRETGELDLNLFERIRRLMFMLKRAFAQVEKGELWGADYILVIADEIQRLCERSPDAALGTIHLTSHEEYTISHPIHCAFLVELVGERLGYDKKKRQVILAATLTANIGMRQLQEQLHTQTAPLTDEQRVGINKHPERSVETLKTAGVKNGAWLAMVLQHHEKRDGSGYPYGLTGEQIYSGAFMISLADQYNAMISSSYKKAVSPTEALRDLYLGSANSEESLIAQMFIKVLGVYPPGAFVQLNNEEVAVVTKRGENGMTPSISSIIAPCGTPYKKPVSRDSKSDKFKIVAMYPDKELEEKPRPETLWDEVN
jgi:HD-GYP domain-containing protein (c-di-GMP phosphodiesterase class II)